MLQQPALAESDLMQCLRQDYGLRITHIRFVPLGADPHSAVYRAEAADKRVYFVKLRRGNFDAVALSLLHFLAEQEASYLIAPLLAQTEQLWAELAAFRVIVYPFVEGQNAYHHALSERQWADFGRALRQLHTITIPASIADRLPREGYNPYWRDVLRNRLRDCGQIVPGDAVALDLLRFLEIKHAEIGSVLERSEQLAEQLRTQQLELVLCHTDVHAGNLLVDQHGHVFIVDWDNPLFAPKERDLMFVGGGLGFAGTTAQLEQRWFFAGYGQTKMNATALAYYRYARLLEDLAIYAEDILSTAVGGADRQQALYYFMANFGPGSTLERAYAADSPASRQERP